MAAADRHARNSGTWASKSPEARQAERRRAAEKAGRVYMTRTEFLAATAQQAEQRRATKRQAWEAEKAQRAVDRELAKQERRKTKPWLGLSVTDTYRLRYRTDPVFRAKEIARTATKRLARGNVAWRLPLNIRLGLDGNCDCAKQAEKHLGYSLAVLRAHLEERFTDGTTWKQYFDGEIVIGHVKPLAFFDLNDPAQFRAAWCLTNLRPLARGDNMRRAPHQRRVWREVLRQKVK